MRQLYPHVEQKPLKRGKNYSPLYLTPPSEQDERLEAQDEMGEVCSTMGEKRGAYRILVGRPERRRPLRRPRRRWEDNINLLKPSGNFTYHQV
jgi:hypothetical protein